MDLNEDKLNSLLGKFVGDLGATMHAGSIVIGEKLGLYKAMATPDERVTAAELARRTNTNERYVREWLNANAASGYIEYDADKDAYYMTPEQSFVMTNEENAAYLPGAFILATSALRAVPTLVDRFRRGAPLAEPDATTIYGGGENGYADYPALNGRCARPRGLSRSTPGPQRSEGPDRLRRLREETRAFAALRTRRGVNLRGSASA